MCYINRYGYTTNTKIKFIAVVRDASAEPNIKAVCHSHIIFFSYPFEPLPMLKRVAVVVP
jgi:hypothetical protein